MIRHIVLWTLKEEKDGQSKVEIALKMKERLKLLQDQISVIKNFEIGINDEEASDSNYDICLNCCFTSIKDLHIYQTHPAHLEFIEYVKTIRIERIAIDYRI